MLLTLDVVAPADAHLGVDRHAFGAAGGTIGRREDCDWVLPDSRVSSRHAAISCRGGVFYIEDTSSNGVFLNSPTHRLPHGQPFELQDGDCLLIVPYEIRVTVAHDAASLSAAPSRREVIGASVAGVPAAPSGYDPFAPRPPDLELVSDEELDPLKLLPSEPRPSRRQSPGDELAAASALSAHYEPPAVAARRAATPPGPVAIPPDYDPLSSDSAPAPSQWAPSPPGPMTPPVATPVPAVVVRAEQAASARPTPGPPDVQHPPGQMVAATSRTDLADVLAGAGLSHVQVTPDLARDLGQILRVVVEGVMDVLRARQHIKDEFRMEVTHFRQADNNPLKFSANVDDALHNLLVKRNAAYLGPVEAFQGAFEDMRDHQMAMLAGIRVAFESTIAEFDPDRLQQQFDRQLKPGSLLNLPGKLRYWELYRDRREALLKDPEATFRRLFGERFAEAYEEQLEMLESGRRGGKDR